MTDRFDIPGRFNPRYSLLGRAVRARVHDASRAEALYYVAAVGALAVFVGVVAVSWAWINLDGPPEAAAADRFWVLQSCGFAVVLMLIGAGVQPAHRVTLDDGGMEVRRRNRQLERIDWAHVQRAERIARETWWSHYRRFAGTTSVVSRRHAHVILLRLEDGRVVILGIRPEEQPLFMERLEARVATGRQALQVA
ncbi:MAG: hypothetical protein JJ896_00080 [Rhodothermales bacterium]|nr:hypothetical protein [Rhodothermales bacterium]MBO6778023.1 hypothetical protein [Rhodothermales bacterium]